MTRASEFWDDVFRNQRREWVADKSAEELIAILALAGPFRDDLAAARSVLDVGPGEARLLKQCVAEGKYASAIEVSAVNRERLKAAGIAVTCQECHNPINYHDADGKPLRPIDLAWSLSCFPHNDYPTQRALLAEVKQRLRPGGVFYLEGVQVAPGHEGSALHEDVRMKAGRYTATVQEVAQWPEYAGLWRTTGVFGREFGKGCPVTGWILRLVKQ